MSISSADPEAEHFLFFPVDKQLINIQSIINDVWLSDYVASSECKVKILFHMVTLDEYTGVWEDILLVLKEQISSYAYRNWFKDNTLLLSVHEHQVEVGVPNGTYKNVIKNKFGRKVRKCCENYFGHRVTVQYTIYGKLAEYLETHTYSQKNGDAQKNSVKMPPKRSNGSSGFPRSVKKVTKDDIIIGGFNKIAVSAVISIINADSDSPNPLFIYGSSGMGKTLLLQMAYHEILNSETGKNVIFTSCEAFMNDYISSLRSGSIDTFRNHFRSTDVFLIDDVHFLGKGAKKRTKEEFYHTVNTLLNAGQQIVVTCDKHPAAVEEIGSDIVNLMMGGMWVQLAPPDMDARVEILRKMSQNTDIPEETCEYIASCYSQDIRELTGAFTTVLRFSTYAGEPCSISIAKKALGTNAAPRKKTGPGIEEIISEVCRYFSVDRSGVFSDSRRKKVVTARHIAIYLCNIYMEETSLGELAGLFSNSRPAILYAGNKITRAVKERDRVIASAVREIRKRLEA